MASSYASTLRNRLQHPWSFVVIVLFLALTILTRDSARAYEETLWATGYDKGGYYAYLPAWFIYQDLSFEFMDFHALLFGKNATATTWGTVSSINSYSMGPAMLLAPFFLLGHLEAAYWGVPQDGFSYTYLFWVATGCLIYATLGLLSLRAVLLRYYDDWPVASALAVLGLGTNLYFYATYDFMMSHAYSFFLFGTSLWWMVRWLEQPKWRTFLALSATAGLLAVTRIPNMVYFLLLALWGVHNKATLLERLQLFWQHKGQIVAGIGVFLLCFAPTVYYWYTQTGHIWVNSYSGLGKLFYWTNPMIAEILIGYRTGWFIYSPLLLLGLVGFIILYRQRSPHFSITLLYLCLHIYVASCWFWWWYAGSFGMRPLIEASVVMAFPLAALFQNIQRGSIISYAMTILVILGIGLNIFQSHQYKSGIIHWNAMSRQSYWAVFGVTHPAHQQFMEERDKHLIHPDLNKELKRQAYKQTIW